MLKLEKIDISGFKAIDKFIMSVNPNLTLMIGMNGSGKSSILQTLGFARYLIEGQPQAFFDERYWNRQDIRFRSTPRSRITVTHLGLRFSSERWGSLRWDVQWGLNGGKLVTELVRKREKADGPIVDVLNFDSREGGMIGSHELPNLGFDGSLLNPVQSLDGLGEAGEITSAILEWGRGIRSLELLSPSAMKGGTRLSPNDMGIKGDRLAGFLAALSEERKARIVARVGRFYPLARFDTTKKRAGWIDLRLAERYSSLGDIHASQMSDGFMRLLALCAVPELGDDVSLILLDEIEDGIEPHILTPLIEMISKETNAQIIATSHSPVLANMFDVENIRFISRTPEGRAIASEAAKMPVFAQGSEYMGPGEIWANTELGVLQREALDTSKAQDASSKAKGTDL